MGQTAKRTESAIQPCVIYNVKAHSITVQFDWRSSPDNVAPALVSDSEDSDTEDDVNSNSEPDSAAILRDDDEEYVDE